MPRVVSANWFSENVSHLCVIGYGRLASLLRLAPPYPTCSIFKINTPVCTCGLSVQPSRICQEGCTLKLDARAHDSTLNPLCIIQVAYDQYHRHLCNFCIN